jgi:type I restriction enzyme S subunit
LHRLRRKTDDIDPGFYVYFLQSAFTQLGIFEGAGNKTTIPNLSRNRLAALEVPKPDYPEQVAIRSVLKRVRAGIATTDDTIERLVELKRATMQELLTRGLRGEPQKETEVGLVPESWELFAVADAVLPFRFDRKKQLKTNRYLPTGQWPIIDQGQKQIAGYTNDEDAIITPSAPIIIFGDHTRTLKFVETPFALGADGTKPLTAGEGWNPRYLFHALCNVSVPSRGYNRHFKQFAESIIAKPGTDEQSELAQIFDAIDDKVDLHQRKLTLLGELFRALLHKLMTREIRLSDLDLSALKTEAAA